MEQHGEPHYGSEYSPSRAPWQVIIHCLFCHPEKLHLLFWKFLLPASTRLPALLRAIIELMAKEFIQWLRFLLTKGRRLSHLVGFQQPEVDHLGDDSLDQE